MTIWKVSTNYKLFNYKKAQEDFNANKPVKIYQSKGSAIMVNEPEIGDIVYFSCNKKEVLIGKVILGFTTGTEHQLCRYNIKPNNTIPIHQETQKYAIIEITSIGSGQEFKGVQRTWTKLRNL
jgi:hypothetical protein